MKNTLLFLTTLFSLTCRAGDLDAQVMTTEFMSRIKGNYDVVSVNGIKPHTNSPAQVSIDDPESAEWAMPYCLSDSCLPGFISFTYANTRVVEERVSATEEKFLITVTENNVVKNFIWREVDGKIFFRNPQYELPGHKLADLEHELRKRVD